MSKFANRKTFHASAVLAAIFTFLVAGCATSPFGNQPSNSQVTIDLKITSSTVTTSGTVQFTATVQNASDTNVIWKVNGIVGGNSTVGTISNGTYTAPFTVPNPAIVTILAAAEANPAKTASAQITITAPAPISVNVAPTPASVQASQQQSFTATVTNDSQNLGVKWTLSGPGCSGATCGTLSASASASGAAISYTAPASVPTPASVTLTATSVADSTKSSSAAITVTAPPAIAVVVAPTAANVQAPNGTKSFSATVTNDPQNKGVTWALTGVGCSGASCGTLSSSTSASGIAITYTAPSSIPSPALVTLTATSVADGTKSSGAAITVTAPPAITVSVSPNASSVQSPSGTQLFTATVTNDSQNKGVTWTLTGAGCTGVACGTLSSSSSASGIAITYTAPATVPSPALVTLTATSVTDGTKSSSAAITVTAPPAIAVSVGPTSANVQAPSGTQPFTATVTNDSQNKGVTWTLSGTGCTAAACGTLSSSTSASGIAITYTAPGSVPTPATVTLTATSVTDASKSAAAAITLSAAQPIVVSLAPLTSNVQAVIGTQPFTATLQNDSQNKGVSWKLSGVGCSGSACGTLSSATSASGTPITYTAPATVPSPATVTLTATSVSDGSKLATATITITAPVGVSVAPPLASLQTGQASNFTATVTNDAKNKGVTWALAGAGCTGATCGTLSATSSASGAAISYTAPAAVPTPATVTLTATSATDTTQSASATITITVAVGNIGVTITPKRGGLTLTQNLNVSATVSNDVGAAGVTWSASGASCSGNACGTFTGPTTTSATYVAPGSAGVYTITATSVADGSKSASATIGVTDLPGVYTYHDDLSRDGANTQEYALTTGNVNSATFGKLFSCPVDGAVYAQPLWVANLTIGGVQHNVVFVATTHDSVYAFDADTNPCQQLWTKSLLGSGETWVDQNDVGTGDIQPDIGIIGTPVIDPVSKLIYVLAKSKDNVPNFYQRLHALSLLDGSESVTAANLTSAISVPGTGDGSSGGVVTFNTLREHNRPGLVFSNGVVYAAFASHGDNGPYHGWVLGFDKTSLALVSKFNANPNGSDSGIWMSGGAPSIDAGGNMYFLTGNGTFDANTGGSDYGDSTVKLSTASGLSVASYFTPADQANLQGGDTDHGSGGAAIIVDQPMGSPHQHLVIGGGKEGNLFLLDRDNLGGYGGNANPVDTNSVQKFSIGNGIFATAAFWNNNLYIAGVGGPLKSFVFNTPTPGQFNTTATSQSNGISFGFPGATPSVSATGSSNGIVWALNTHSYCTQQSSACGPALLYAFDATNVATNLYNSGQNAARDAAGNAVKFTVPTVANGKVYVGTRGNNAGGASGSTSSNGELDVYGLLPN